MTDRLLRAFYLASYEHYEGGQWKRQLNYRFHLDQEDDSQALRLALGYAEKFSTDNKSLRKELRLRELFRTRPIPFPADTRLGDTARDGLEQQLARAEFSGWG